MMCSHFSNIKMLLKYTFKNKKVHWLKNKTFFRKKKREKVIHILLASEVAFLSCANSIKLYSVTCIVMHIYFVQKTKNSS